MIKKLGILILLFIGMLLFEACICNCKDTKPKSTLFRFEDLSLNITSSVFDGDTFVRHSLFSEDSLSQKHYSLKAQLTVSLAKKHSFLHSFELINSAIACKCASLENIFNAKDSIIDLKIITLNDFDAQHLTGADVTAYFVGLEQEYGPLKIKSNKIDLAFVKKHFNTSYGGLVPHGVHAPILALDQTPKLNRNVAFKIICTTQSGQIFEETSRPIYLLQ